MKLHTLRCNADFTLQRKQFDGRPHLVVPVVLMVEGVHQAMNSEPLFYSGEVLSHIPDKWNDTASLVFHPLDSNGNPISANSIEVHENQVIGRLFNTTFDHPSLKSEAWIDEEKAREQNPEFIEALERGDRIEVSTGVFVESDNKKGSWNGEDYDGAVINQWPDHLAILPSGEGACNWVDGCGIRDNGAKNMKLNVRSNSRTPVYSGTESLSYFDMPTSFEHIRRRLTTKIGEQLGVDSWVLYTFSDYAIYEVFDESEENKFSIGYTYDVVNDTVTLTGDPQAVGITEQHPVTITKDGVELFKKYAGEQVKDFTPAEQEGFAAWFYKQAYGKYPQESTGLVSFIRVTELSSHRDSVKELSQVLFPGLFFWKNGLGEL